MYLYKTKNKYGLASSSPRYCRNRSLKIIKMRLLLLLLPAVALASIEVNMGGKVFLESKYIQGGFTPSGFEKRLVTYNDRTAFQMQDDQLKSDIKKYNGKNPDQIFLSRDTPFGDLYRTNGWNPVEVKIEPKVPYMIDMTTNRVVLTRSMYQNVQYTAKSMYIRESETTQDTVKSFWSNPKKVLANNVTIKFNFQVDNDLVSVNYGFSFGYNGGITEKRLKSQSTTMNLAPGQKVFAQLEAKKGSLTFQIPYNVSLSGEVAVHYKNKYKDRYFYGLNINSILRSARRETALMVYQTITYEFIYGVNLRVYAENGAVLKSYEAEAGTSSGHRRRASAANHAAEIGEKIMMKAAVVPIDIITDEEREDLNKNIKEVLHLDEEESEESSEEEDSLTAEKIENKTPLEVPKSE